MPYGEGNVRAAAPQDARAIAQVHVRSSKTTYKGIFSVSRLGRLSVEDSARFWKKTLTTTDPKLITLVGCDEAGRVVGFLCGGIEKTGRLGCAGELSAIYLLQAAQRQGLGTLLVRRFVRELRSWGFASMATWVLARNPSRKFYEALGGKVIAEREVDRDGESFAEIAYGWSDLSKFGS